MNGSLFQEALLSGSYGPKFYAFYYKQWSNYQMPFHVHDSTEIMYMISGQCRIDVRAGEGQEQRVVLRKGEFIVLDSGVPHRLIVDADSSCRMLNVEFGFTDRGQAAPDISAIAGEEEEVASFLRRDRPYLVLSDQEEVYPVLRSLVLELDRRGTGPRTITNVLFIQLLVSISRLAEERERGAFGPSELYAKRSIDYLHQHYDQNIRIKDVAMAVNLHPGYLQRIFRKETGHTLTAYLTMIRMEKAKQLLSRTDIPIPEISEYVGVASRQYFHALFKKYTKVTPAQYRQNSDKYSWDRRLAEPGGH
ncbi:helix-turn-helix transcriptional regulator [Paenibacillus campinasensis]|uniref:AraC family transcriptional regulator n=1 Tax=Paenibacillus campinasensis TaxID=66347 RepID=A0A268EJ02_9BACL|nr:AraC family transcriptional regulator [Paenibacillus campinasensis]PAD73110.1 AraC family transcriptional regulator [Paenibacillus campinasensis]